MDHSLLSDILGVAKDRALSEAQSRDRKCREVRSFSYSRLPIGDQHQRLIRANVSAVDYQEPLPVARHIVNIALWPAADRAHKCMRLKQNSGCASYECGSVLFDGHYHQLALRNVVQLLAITAPASLSAAVGRNLKLRVTRETAHKDFIARGLV